VNSYEILCVPNISYFIASAQFCVSSTLYKTKTDTKEHNNRQNVNICIRNLDTNKKRKQLNIFKRKVYRRILGPLYDNKKNWRILTNKEIYAIAKKNPP
jgi:hypothetical protein